MADEMLVAQSQWLPQYRDAVPEAKKRLKSQPRLGTHTGKGAARLLIKSVEEMRRDKAAARENAGAADKAAKARAKSAGKKVRG